MTKTVKIIKTLVILVLVMAVFGGAMFALNLYTGPIIESNNAGAANDRLNAVMPGGNAYEEITATLSNVPANVNNVYKETSGLGYVIACTANSDYSTSPMEIIIGVSADGKICGIQIESYNDTESFDFRKKDPNYLTSYIGKDSALADIGTVSGSTFSSTAFKNAVSDAMGVLISNNLIAEGVKTDAQILAEMIPELHTGLTSSGLLKAEKIEAKGNIVEGYKALNGSGYAFIIKNGEVSFLAIVNASGVCKVYDTTGADVTESNTAVCEEAIAASDKKDFTDEAEKMLLAKYTDATEITPIELTTFGNVVYASSFKSADKTYYAFYSCPLTYGDNAMSICTVIDENGAIVSQDVKEFLFGHGVEYLPVYGSGYGDVSSDTFKAFEEKYNGINTESLSDDVLVSGATLSSTATKLATKDAFNAFDSIKGGVQ